LLTRSPTCGQEIDLFACPKGIGGRYDRECEQEDEGGSHHGDGQNQEFDSKGEDL